MSEQEKREKVISDLEEQIAWIRDNDFHKFPGWGHAVLAMRDAFAMLKAQEPRVMTLEEAQNSLHNDIVVWVELKDKILCGGIRMDGTDYFTMQNNDVLDITDFDSGEGAEMYGKEVRCWTSPPDEKRRAETPWEQ